MWQQELENRRRRRIAQQEKRELQEYIKKQMAEQKERQRLERESWKSLAPAPRTSFFTPCLWRCASLSHPPSMWRVRLQPDPCTARRSSLNAHVTLTPTWTRTWCLKRVCPRCLAPPC